MEETPDTPAKKLHNGVRPGEATTPQPHGGRIGQAPFKPTDEQRIQVKALAQALVEHVHIATIIGCDKKTLYKYFRAELDRGAADCISRISSMYVKAALDGDKKAMRVVLEKRGGWSTKIEHGGREGGPIETVDLSRLSPEQLEQYGRLAAIAEGLDPDALVATVINRD